LTSNPGYPTAADGAAQVRRAKNAVYIVFISFGFASASWAARIPQVRSALHLSPGVLGLILLSAAIGPAVAIPLTGIAIARVGEARVVAATGIIAALGLGIVAVGYRHGIPPVAGGLFVFGFGSGAGDVAMNVQGTVVERALGRAILPRFHAGWSVGTVAGAGIGTAMVAWHVPVTAHLIAVALAVGVAIATATRGFMSLDAEPVPAGALAGRRSPLAAWTETRTLLIGLFVLCMTVIEGIGNSWLSLGVISGYHAAAVLGTATLSVFLAAMTAGRWFGPRVIDRRGHRPGRAAADRLRPLPPGRRGRSRPHGAGHLAGLPGRHERRRRRPALRGGPGQHGRRARVHGLPGRAAGHRRAGRPAGHPARPGAGQRPAPGRAVPEPGHRADSRLSGRPAPAGHRRRLRVTS
jgi:Major Facilitator Superfamily